MNIRQPTIPRRTVARLASAVALAAALTACSSTAKTVGPAVSVSPTAGALVSNSPVSWSTALCKGLVAIGNDASGVSAVGDTLTTDPLGAQKVIETSFSQLSTDLQTLRMGLLAVGAPSVANGATVQSTLVDAIQTGETALDMQIATLAAVSSTDQGTVTTAVKLAATQAGSALNAVGAAFDAAEKDDTSGDLEKAISANPECASVAGNGASPTGSGAPDPSTSPVDPATTAPADSPTDSPAASPAAS